MVIPVLLHKKMTLKFVLKFQRTKCLDSAYFAGKEKYPNKEMVWIVISNRGISKQLFRPSKSEAVNSDIYINDCLEKCLIPFILEHHSDSNYIFWYDLAG